jgi:hypothetical protein
MGVWKPEKLSEKKMKACVGRGAGPLSIGYGLI